MKMYKLICVFVLCFVFAGATMVASSKCVYGVCKPYKYCQTAQLSRTLGKDISLCNSGGAKKLVCCYDNMASKVPFVSNAIYLVNIFNFGTRATPVRTSTASYGHYRSGTNLPQRPSISTGYLGWPTTSTTTTARPVATTPPPRPTTTEYVPPVYDYVTNEPVFDGCRDLDPKLTTNKIGRPAWDKCIEYQQLVYPCQRSVTLLGNMVRANNCAHASFSRIKTAHANEFPHVVVLGFRRRSEEPLRWACTGTLISERFTLSSAYCLSKRDSNDQIYAAVGFQQHLVGNTEEYQEYRMEPIFYNPPYNVHNEDYRYHDIALLKSATDIRLNQWVIPACLDVFGDDGFSAVATRWRARSWNKTNLLQKVFVHQLSKQEYQNKFPNGNRVANQMGYGSYGMSNENCKFDNEGSLTVENHLVHCMHTLKGVFSSAIRPTCGRLPSGSYTRIADYTSWIEQIVWPTEKK